MLPKLTIHKRLSSRSLLNSKENLLLSLFSFTKLARSLLSIAGCNSTSKQQNLNKLVSCDFANSRLNHSLASKICKLALLPRLKGTHCDISRQSKEATTMFSKRKMGSASDSESSTTVNSRHEPDPNCQKPKTNTGVIKTKPKFSKEELKARLSPIQYQVTQLKSTERPGTGEYNKFNKKGTYHCVVCDDELFKSDTKFESGCGWPAFFDTIDKSKLKFVQDFSLVGASNLLLIAKKADLVRTEVLCNNCDAHLGHRFDDGPASKGGTRYCINSAALKFVQKPDS